MKGITITEKLPNENMLAFDLIDILKIVGPDAIQSNWTISEVEVLGAADSEAVQKIYSYSENGNEVHGKELIQIASELNQIIDGQFSGRQRDQQEPWIIIRAVDSAAFDVFCDDSNLLSELQNRFKDSMEIPQ